MANFKNDVQKTNTVPALISRDDSQILKGFAILIMIAHHAFGFLSWVPANAAFYEILKENAWLSKIFLHGYVCVPIFLFITGVGLASNAQKEFFPCLKKSLFNFEKIYLPSVVIGSLLLMFFPVEYPDGITHFATLKTSLLALLGYGRKVCGVWWYASAFLLAIFLMFPLFRFLFSQIEKTFWKTAFLSLAICAFFRIFGIKYCELVPAFALGYFTGTLNFSLEKPFALFRKFREMNYFLRNTIAILVFLAFTSIDFIRPTSRGIAILPGAILLFISLVPAGTFTAKILQFFGKYSGLMWLNHTFFLNYYLRHELYSIPSVIGVFVATTALSLVAAMIMHWIIFAFPWKTFLDKIKI